MTHLEIIHIPHTYETHLCANQRLRARRTQGNKHLLPNISTRNALLDQERCLEGLNDDVLHVQEVFVLPQEG